MDAQEVYSTCITKCVHIFLQTHRDRTAKLLAGAWGCDIGCSTPTASASVGQTSLSLLCRPQHRLLQWLRACTRHLAKHRDTTVAPTCATVAFREMSSTAPMKYSTASYRDTSDSLWTSGDAQTHNRRLTPAELPH